jgi:hypothetical protein
MSHPIPARHYHDPVSGTNFSPFTSWKPDTAVLVTVGWTVSHDDGTTGLGRKPFATQAEAQAWCDANPRFRGMGGY